MITYSEKGVGLHEAIAGRGYRLEQLDGVWRAWRMVDGIWLDDAEAEEAVQEIIDTYVPANPVPDVVSRRQLRKALALLGLSGAVDVYVQAMDPVDRLDWEEATQYERQHPMVLAGIAALGITDAQADDIFRLAGTL